MKSLRPSLQDKARAEQERRRRAKEKQGQIPAFPDWLPQVTPTFTWDWPYLRHIQQHLDSVTSGACKRLMLFIPPRHGKSEMVTVRYPVWRMARNPELRVIIGAYNQILANKFSRKARRVATGCVQISKDRVAVEDWETLAGGGLRAVAWAVASPGRAATSSSLTILSRAERKPRAKPTASGVGTGTRTISTPVWSQTLPLS